MQQVVLGLDEDVVGNDGAIDGREGYHKTIV
jgi:hypothetical protein